jgi:hypothetical protein
VSARRALSAALASPWWLRTRYRSSARRSIEAAERHGSAQASPPALRALLRRLYGDCDSVLDVGTGRMRSLVEAPCRVRIGLDAHRPYLENRMVPDAVPINASALQLEELFVRDAVDLVTLMDVLEHFPTGEALDLLRQAEVVARTRVLLFTPRGEFPQEGHDPLGLGGEELQKHRSSWEPSELAEQGYTVIVLPGYHGPGNPSFVAAFGTDAPRVDALVAWKSARPPA